MRFNLEKEAKRIITNYFLSFEIQYKPKRNSLHDYFIDLMNLKTKLIEPVPRIVYKSNKFSNINIPYDTFCSLISIDNKIRKGEDITYHMSKKVLEPVYNDLLLNTWVIQHFHLSTTKKRNNQKFYDRSDYLLFAVFSDNCAFFIDVQKHKENQVFSKQEYLKTLFESWPELLDEYDLNKNHENSIRTNDYSDEEIEQLTKKGYSIGMLNVGDKTIFTPGIGITTSGHNIHTIRRADYLYRYLHQTYESIRLNEQLIFKKISLDSNISSLNIRLKMVDEFPFIKFYETNSNKIIDESNCFF